MQRAQRLFERQGLNVLPFPVDFQARGRWAGPLWRDPTSGCLLFRRWMTVPFPA